MWNFFEGLDQGISRADPSTWHNWTGRLNNGIIYQNGIGQSDLLWFLRSRPPVKRAFANIWDTDDLVTSFDGMGVFRPWQYCAEWKTEGGWYHVDQVLGKNFFFLFNIYYYLLLLFSFLLGVVLVNRGLPVSIHHTPIGVGRGVFFNPGRGITPPPPTLHLEGRYQVSEATTFREVPVAPLRRRTKPVSSSAAAAGEGVSEK